MTSESPSTNGEEHLITWLKHNEGRLILICLIIIVILMITYIITLNNNIELLKSNPCELCLQHSNNIMNYYKGG